MEQAKKRYFRENLKRTLMAAWETYGDKFLDTYEEDLERTILAEAAESAEEAGA